MNWIEDYDPKNPNNVTYSMVTDVFKEVCKRVAAAEEKIIKHWFEMAFAAGRDYEDLEFEAWWNGFYSALQQGAERGD